jgi:hypothetical protein
MAGTPFSRRHGYVGQAKEITIREEAPESLRYCVLRAASEAGLKPSTMRSIVCDILETRPDPNNWSEYPNIDSEVEVLVYGCEWFEVYDVIEGIWSVLKERDERGYEDEQAPQFERKLNDFFVRKGIGWQIVDGLIVTRGAEAFEQTVKTARATLGGATADSANAYR